MERFRYLFIPLALCFLIGVIYLYTAAPSMLWLDAGDMAAAAATLGVNTPPAPFYVFIGHFFTLLPFGSLIFRLQIFSALTASASLYLLYKITIKLIDEDKNEKVTSQNRKIAVILAGLFSILTLAFSYEFWAQAQNTDRFILACFMELLILYLIIVYASHKKFQSLLFVLVFLSGLAFGVDPVVICFYPTILFVLWQKRNAVGMGGIIQLCVTGLAGILLVLSYLPLVTLHNPFLDFERPTTLARIWGLMTAPQSNTYTATTESGNGFTASFSVFLRSSGHFFVMIWQSFTPLLLPFVVTGGWYIWKIRKDVFLMLILITITNFILSGLYLSGNQESWYLLSDVVLALFAGCGYFWVSKKLSFNWIGIVLFLFSFSPLIFWWSTLNRHALVLMNDYKHNLFGPINGNAIIYGDGDLFINTANYLLASNNSKSHLIPIVDSIFIYFKGYRENLGLTTDLRFPNDMVLNGTESPQVYSNYLNNFFAMNLQTHKIYVTYSMLSSNYFKTQTDNDSSNFILDTSRFKLIPQCMVEEVVLKNSTEKPNLATYNFHFSNGFPQTKPKFLENVYNGEMAGMIDDYASAYTGLGDYFVDNKNSPQALFNYQKAYALDPQNTTTLDKLGFYYIKINKPNQALVYFTKAYKIDNTNPRIMYDIGVVYIHLGQKDTAMSWLIKALKEAKNNPQVYAETAQALTYLGANTKQQDTWQGFSNPQIGLSFTYPPGYTTQLVSQNLIGLFAAGQNNPTMEFYSTKAVDTMDLDTFAQTFPYAIKGTLTTSKPASIEGFEESNIYAYQTGPTQTELILLKENNQIIAVIIPLNAQTSSVSFATTLTKIIRSIRTLQ